MNIAIISFSPTGGTLKCADTLAQAMGKTVQNIDLTDRSMSGTAVCHEADIVIIAVPSYGGRVPLLAAERLRKVSSRNKKAVLLTVYGNRAFEDTMAELNDIAEALEFDIVAAVAAIAQHCMDAKIATGRPDADDIKLLQDFGHKIAQKVSSGKPSALGIPGNRPYKSAGAGMVPATDKSCVNCGLCARQCPAGAIPADNVASIDTNLCLGCMRCVTNCPTGSKRLPAAKRLLVHGFLSLAAKGRKEPELFI